MLEGDPPAREGTLDDAASTQIHERLEAEQHGLNSQELRDNMGTICHMAVGS